MPPIKDTCHFRFDGIQGGLTSQALALAVAIADAAARADIEIHAPTWWSEGLRYFDCTVSANGGPEAAERAEFVRRAVAYIHARGDVFPWQLKQHIAHPAWVHFEEKPARAELSPELAQLAARLAEGPSVEEVRRRQCNALLGLPHSFLQV